MGWICEDQEIAPWYFVVPHMKSQGFPCQPQVWSSVLTCWDNRQPRGVHYSGSRARVPRDLSCVLWISHFLSTLCMMYRKCKTDYWTTRHYVICQFQVPQSPCLLYAQLLLNWSYHRLSVSDLDELVVSEAMWTTIGKAKENPDWIQLTVSSCTKSDC